MNETSINLQIAEKKKKIFPILIYSITIFIIAFFIFFMYDSILHSSFIRIYVGGSMLILTPLILFIALKYNINHTPKKLVIDDIGIKIFYDSTIRTIDWLKINKIDYSKEFNERILCFHLTTKDIILVPVSPSEDILITNSIQDHSRSKFF